ncbi:alpha/beta hydrolase [Streptomonospora sp. S1-112]|uniref:Alpha/beta hydrolase n=1 Tax=Streptomonospora mangrovi TaxID=2883123 RepID=A0A9X3NP05_9ACTN|nr:alpha/beta hydrolase [Streptomonospora mangrovi]MDA0565683.1 alpha/beta hydrolase [Streptomonospora mangrovi]
MTDTAPAARSHWIRRPEGDLHVLEAGGTGETGGTGEAGATGTPVVLLSGAGVDNALLSWRRLIPALAPRHRVLAPDWPKQGRSRPWRGKATHSAMLDVVTAVLDHFGVERAALVGLSQGGALALAYAIDHPDRVDRLVALAPAGVLSFPPVVHQLLWLTAKTPLLNSTLPTLALRGRPAVARFVRGALIPGPTDDFDAVVDEVHAEVRASGAGSSDWQNDSIGFLRMRVDLRPRLPEIACPVLFIQGDRDVGVPPARTAEAARLVPGARLEVLEGHGHWANRQSPERVNALIADFLAE